MPGPFKISATEAGKLLRAAREKFPEAAAKAVEILKSELGDIWSRWKEPDTWIGVPTHQDRRVGTGVYKQAVERIPGLAEYYAKPDTPAVLRAERSRVVLLPTVPAGQEVADPTLIKKSLETIKPDIDSGKIKRLVIPRLGTGQGGLQWARSKQVIEEALGGRDVTVVEASKEVLQRQTTKEAEAVTATAPVPPLREIRERVPGPVKPVEIPPLADAELKEQFTRLTTEITAAQTRQQSAKIGAAGGGMEERNVLLDQINQQIQKATGLRAWAERAMRAGSYTKKDGTPVVVDAAEKARLQKLIKKQGGILGGLTEKKNAIEETMGAVATAPDIQWEWVSPEKQRPYIRIIDPTGEFNRNKLRAEFGRIEWNFGLRGPRGARYMDKSFVSGEARGYIPQQVTLPALRVNVPSEFQPKTGEAIAASLKEGGERATEIFGRLKNLDPKAPPERLAQEALYFTKLFGDAPLDNYRIAEDTLVAGISSQINKELTGSLRFEALPHLWQAARYPDYIRGVEILRGRRIPMTAIEGQGMRRLEKILARAGLTFNKLGEEGPFEIRPGRQQEVRDWIKEAYIRPRVEKITQVLQEVATKSGEAGDPYLSGEVLGEALANILREQPAAADDIRRNIVDLIWDEKTGTIGLLNQLRTAVASRVSQQIIAQGGRFPVRMTIPFYSPRLGTGEAGTSGLNTAFVNLSGLPKAAAGIQWAPERLAEAVRVELNDPNLWHPLSVAQRNVGRSLARDYPNFVALQSMGPSLESKLFPGLSRSGRVSGEGIIRDNTSIMEKLRPVRAEIEEIAARGAGQDLIENSRGMTRKIVQAATEGDAAARASLRNKRLAVEADARKMVAEMFDAAEKNLPHYAPSSIWPPKGNRKHSVNVLFGRGAGRLPVSVVEAIEEEGAGFGIAGAGGDPVDLLLHLRNMARNEGLIAGEPIRSAIRRIGSTEAMGEVRVSGTTEFPAQVAPLVGQPVEAAKAAFYPSGFVQRMGAQLKSLGPERKPPAAEFPKRPLEEAFPTPERRREIGIPTDVGGQIVTRGLEGKPSILGQERDIAEGVINKLFSDNPTSTSELHGLMAGLFNRWKVERKIPGFELGIRAGEVGKQLAPGVPGPITIKVVKAGKVVTGQEAATILEQSRQGLDIPAGYTLRIVGGAPQISVKETQQLQAGASVFFVNKLRNFIAEETMPSGNIAKMGAERRDWVVHRLDQLHEAMASMRGELTDRQSLKLLDTTTTLIDEATAKLRKPMLDTLGSMAEPRVRQVSAEAIEAATAVANELLGPITDIERGEIIAKLAQNLGNILKGEGGFFRFGAGPGAERLVEARSTIPARTLWEGIRDVGAGLYRLPEKWARNHDSAMRILNKGWEFAARKLGMAQKMYDEVVEMFSGLSLEDRWAIVDAVEGKLPVANLRPGLQIVAAKFHNWTNRMAEYIELPGINERIRNRVGDVITRDFFGRPEKYLVKQYLPNGFVELEGKVPVPGLSNWAGGQTFQRAFQDVNPHYRPNFFPHVFKGQWVAYNGEMYKDPDPAKRELAMKFFRTKDEAVQWVLHNAEWNPISLKEIHSTGGDAAVQAWLDQNGIKITARITMPADTRILMSSKALGRLSSDLTAQLTETAREELRAQGFSQAVVDSVKMGSKDVWHALRQELGLIPKKRFIATTQPRKLNLRDYVKDPLEAMHTYVHSAVNGVEGNRFRTAIFGREGLIHPLKEAAQLDQRLRPTFEYMSKWAEEIETSRPTFNEELLDYALQFAGREHGFAYRRFLTTASSLMSIVKLGNPMSALVNLTQTAINTYPVLGNRTFTGMEMALQLRFNPTASYRGQRLDVLAKAGDVELYLPKYAIDAYGIRGNRGKMSFYILYLFNEAEKVNRSIAFFGGYAKGLDKGMTHEQAVEMAKRWALDRTQFRYGVEALPGLFRDPTMRALLQFKPYLVHELNFIGDLVNPSAKIQRYDPYWKELSRFLVISTSFAGLLGLPFVEKIDHMVFNNTKDPRTGEGFSFIDELKRVKPELGRFGDVPLRGLGSLFGLDLSQRVGLNVDADNIAEMLFNPQMTVSKLSRAFSPWTGLLNDLREAVMDFYYNRDEIAADRLAKAIFPVQLYSLYSTLKTYSGQTPRLQTIGGTQLPIISIPPAIVPSGYVRPGEIRSPIKEGALLVRLDPDDPNTGYKLLLKAIGGRLIQESEAGEAYERYGPQGDVVQGFKNEANRVRRQYLQLLNSGRIEEANLLAREAAPIYGLDAKDFQREQQQWERTLLERAGRAVPKQLRPTVYEQLRGVEPGLELPSSRRRKRWY